LTTGLLAVELPQEDQARLACHIYLEGDSMSRPLRFLASFLLPVALVAVPSTLLAQAPVVPPTCIAGTRQDFLATGSLKTYSVPPNTSAIYIMANGASGGSAAFLGGYGAHIGAEVPVSGGTALSVVVGAKGLTASSGGTGGGGGSFVFDGSTLLVAAGGGGGAGISANGSDAKLGPSGSAGGDGTLGGTNGQGGDGSSASCCGGGGGGGFLGGGGNGQGNAYGLGGHQINGGDAAGGGTTASGAGVGGYGGGGGGGEAGAGGGGGYSGGGGGGGSGDDEGGGGGSFVAASGTTFESAILGSRDDGSVTICVTQESDIPTLAPWGLAALALVLLSLGVLVIVRRP
jgi:hypothetical protein